MIGKDVTVTIGDKELDFNLSSEVIEPIEFESQVAQVGKGFSFNAESTVEFSGSAEFSGVVTYDDGMVMKLKGMKSTGPNHYFSYNFKCGSISVKRYMKTKSKQPRTIAVWREI